MFRYLKRGAIACFSPVVVQRLVAWSRGGYAVTGRTFKTVSQCYFGRCPSSRGTGKEEPPGALYPQGQIKLRLGRRQVWLRRTRLPRIPLLLHNTEETREADCVGLLRICELPRLVEPGKENNGADASERRTRGPQVCWLGPGRSGGGLVLWSGGMSGSTEHRAGPATTNGEPPGPNICRFGSALFLVITCRRESVK